ncbi:restriction endonuclease subunit S [Enterobacter genomosp. O]|uniref:restriction endonuclease subunit S n=1 Tax=Enterobacter genomosp. O TaxID=2364150 RepID=UPI000907F524|nr:restriction endonuclease subunit S [Enterobacter genomosp. O]
MSREIYKLSELCLKITDGSHNPPEGIPHSDYLMLSSKNIFDDEINFDNPRYLSKEMFEKENKRTEISEGDVLLTIVGTIGRVAVVPDDIAKFTLQRSVAVLKPKMDVITPRFLMYTLQSMLDVLTAGARGVAQKGIYLKQLADLQISVPPLIKQKEIVAIFDKVRKIQKKRKKAIKMADDFLRATFLAMFGTPAHNIHCFPKGTIRDLVDSVNYGTSAKASVDSGEYPVLRMGNITYQGGWDFTELKYLDLSVKEMDKFLVKKGDLLFNRTNSKELVGKTAVYGEDRPMAFAGYLIRVRPNSIGNNYYISGYLNSIHGKITLMNMCKSIVGMANINAQEFQNIEILIPPKHLLDEYEIIYKRIKKGLTISYRSVMQLQQLASNLSNRYFM